MSTFQVNKKGVKSQYLFGYDDRGKIDGRFTIHSITERQIYYNSNVKILKNIKSFTRRKTAMYIRILEKLTKDEFDYRDDIFKVSIFKKGGLQECEMSRLEIYEKITMLPEDSRKFNPESKPKRLVKELSAMEVKENHVIVVQTNKPMNMKAYQINELKKYMQINGMNNPIVIIDSETEIASMTKSDVFKMLRDAGANV